MLGASALQMQLEGHISIIITYERLRTTRLQKAVPPRNVGAAAAANPVVNSGISFPDSPASCGKVRPF